MAKETITIRIDGDLIDSLDSEAEDRDITRSEYVRQILQKRHRADELRDEIDSLLEQLDRRQERIETLESEPSAPFFIEWLRWWRNR